MRFQDQPHALFLPGAVSAMREPFAASHFRQVCARSITARVVAANVGGFWRKILQGSGAAAWSSRPSKSSQTVNAFLTLPALTKW